MNRPPTLSFINFWHFCSWMVRYQFLLRTILRHQNDILPACSIKNRVYEYIWVYVGMTLTWIHLLKAKFNCVNKISKTPYRETKLWYSISIQIDGTVNLCRTLILQLWIQIILFSIAWPWYLWACKLEFRRYVSYGTICRR